MLLFDVLPKDILVMLLVYCDTSTLQTVSCINYKLNKLIRSNVIHRINKLLSDKYDKRYIKIESHNRKCSICTCKIYYYPYIRLFSTYHYRPLHYNKAELILLVDTRTISYKERKKKLRE